MIKKGKGRITITLDEKIIENIEGECIIKGITKSELLEKLLKENDYHIPYEYSSKRNSSNSSFYKP